MKQRQLLSWLCIGAAEQRRLAGAVLRLLTVAWIACSAAFSPPSAAAGPVPPPAPTYTVNTLTDGHDTNPADDVCYNGVDGCGLRAALEQSVGRGHLDAPVQIFFNIPEFPIQLDGALGMLVLAADHVHVDGGNAQVFIDGVGLAADQPVLRITGNYNNISNLIIKGGPQDGIQVGDYTGTGNGGNNRIERVTFLDNAGSAVVINGGDWGVFNNVVAESLFGTNSLSPTGCFDYLRNGWGIYVYGRATGTRISDNIIVCSRQDGIVVDGAISGAPHNTEITGNLIGAVGSTELGNGTCGIYEYSAEGTTISGNLVSGNADEGIWLNSSNSAAIANNVIGASASGQEAVPNGRDGILLSNGTKGCSIGALSNDEKNIISGNTLHGIHLAENSDENSILSNWIGLAGDGLHALPNGQAGIAIQNGSDNNQLGAAANGWRLFSSGNTREGVYIENSDGTLVYQNVYLGVGVDEVTPVGNGREGALIFQSSGSLLRPGRTAFNGAAGIALVGGSSIKNTVWPGSAHSNGGIPIDLGNDGFTPNGLQTPPGPNGWLGYLVIAGIQGRRVTFSTCSDCTVLVYAVQRDARFAGGGGEWIGSCNANSDGLAVFDVPASFDPLAVAGVSCLGGCSAGDPTSKMEPLMHSRLYLPFAQREG